MAVASVKSLGPMQGKSAFRWLILVSLLSLLCCTAQANLARNGGFEQCLPNATLVPEWMAYATKVSKVEAVPLDKAAEGKMVVKISAQQLPKQFQGLTQRLAVQEGKRYSLSARTLNNNDDRFKGTGSFRLGIEWLDKEGKEISRESSHDFSIDSSQQWKTISLEKKKAPKGATEAIFGVHVVEGDRGSVGSFFVDDVQIVER